DGVYVAEPKIVPDAKLNEQISYDSMIEMANMGAGVLKTESVEMAKKYRIKIGVGSSYTGKVGTIVTDYSLDSSSIDGIISQKNMTYISVESDSSEVRKRLFEKMAQRRIKVQTFLNHNNSAEFIL
ncbi:MAG: aspartate kinase, partial [Aliifodinibius sp.]|nr:aspartate kinase [Fodinibius sp.]